MISLPVLSTWPTFQLLEQTEYSFQFEENNGSDTYLSLKEKMQTSEPMELVNIKAKIVDMGELQIVSQKQYKMK